MNPVIRFDRIERVCQFNAELPPGSKRKLYDFHVIINGEHRATLHRNTSDYYFKIPGLKSGSDFVREQRPQSRTGPQVVHVKSQLHFLGETERLLAAGLIPTLAEIQEKIETASRAVTEAEIRNKKERNENRLHSAGPKFYETLKAIAAAATLPREEVDTIENQRRALDEVRRITSAMLAEIESSLE